MPKFIAFLRAINVGGHVVKMEELRRLFEAMNFKEVETFIASGNVIFAANSTNSTTLERRIEDHLQKSLGYEVKTFLRSDSEVASIAQYKPFDAPQLHSALTSVVGFLAAPLEAEASKRLMDLRTEIDDFHLCGRELYWISKRRQSESAFSNALFERTLKVRATFRGINTIVKLAARNAAATAKNADPRRISGGRD